MSITLKSNYQRLQENKAATLEFVQQIKPTIPPSPAEIKTKYSEVRSLVQEGRLDSAIWKLQEIKDNRLGINWRESDDLGNGTKALVRDARNQVKDQDLLEKDLSEKYVIQALNQVRAAQTLIDQGGLAPSEANIAKQKLAHIANGVVSGIDIINADNIKLYNTQMVHVLEQTNLTKEQNLAGKEVTISLEKQLNFAKDVVMLHDEHRHIVTLSEVKDQKNVAHTMIEAEIMLNGLSDKQKEEYSKIATSKAKKETGVPWFDSMPEYQQKLLRGVAPDILTENKLIPTQFQGKTAGLRNAYQKVTAIQEQDQEKAKILLESLHCGTPAAGKDAYLSKEEKKQITAENIKQIQSFTKEGEKINLNILNSKLAGSKRGPLAQNSENYIFENIEAALTDFKQENKVGYSSTPLNELRLLMGSGRETTEFQNNLAKMANSLQQSDTAQQHDLKHTVKYLTEGASISARVIEKITFGVVKTNETRAKLELENLTGQLAGDLNQALTSAIRSRELIDLPVAFTNSSNANLELATRMNNLTYKASQGQPKELAIKNAPININSCKSGKDRTGWNETKQSIMAVANHFGAEIGSSVEREIFKNVVAASHSQRLTGLGAGSAGCDSIKTSVSFQLDKIDRSMQKVVTQASNMYNRIKLSKDKKQTIQAINELEKSYSLVNKPCRIYQAEFTRAGKAVTLTPKINSSAKTNNIAKLVQESGVKINDKYKNNIKLAATRAAKITTSPKKDTGISR